MGNPATSSPAGSSKPAGWYKDPGGRYDWRYFDGSWTDEVQNEGDDSTYIDAVPSSPPVPIPDIGPPPAVLTQPQSMMPVRPFAFDGGAGSFVGTAILAFLVTVFTLGICYPWGVVMMYRWRTKHTIVNGHRLRFTGSAWGLFGHWIKWWVLIVITLGIYGFWVYPRLTKWITEHQEFDPAFAPN